MDKKDILKRFAHLIYKCQEITKVKENPSSIVSNPSSTVSNPSSIVSNPSSIVSNPSSTVSNPFSIFLNPSSIFLNPSSIFLNPSSILSNPSSILSNPSSILSENPSSKFPENPFSKFPNPSSIVSEKPFEIVLPTPQLKQDLLLRKELIIEYNPEFVFKMFKGKYLNKLLTEENLINLKVINILKEPKLQYSTFIKMTLPKLMTLKNLHKEFPNHPLFATSNCSIRDLFIYNKYDFAISYEIKSFDVDRIVETERIINQIICYLNPEFNIKSQYQSKPPTGFEHHTKIIYDLRNLSKENALNLKYILSKDPRLQQHFEQNQIIFYDTFLNEDEISELLFEIDSTINYFLLK